LQSSYLLYFPPLLKWQVCTIMLSVYFFIEMAVP
jgi:hypothetical protein